MSRGHHNRNFVVPLTEPLSGALGRGAVGKPVTVRIPRREALPVVIRSWPDEAEILAAIKGVLPMVPQCLAKHGDVAVHSYVEGVPLSSVCQNGKPVDSRLIKALAGLLAEMVKVRRDDLPRLPSDWPRSTRDSSAFLRTMALQAERQIRQPNWTEFGGLFAALGIPEDALVRFAERVPAMAHRPYSLLHTDLHRDNVIVSYHGDPPLICVDWELATYGDPLHDLATHLVRMRYPDFQWGEVVDAWSAAMERTAPMAVNGLKSDLKLYVAFERAQSVYPDVMRAANSLGAAFDQKSLDQATAAAYRALLAAAGPLRLSSVPDESEVERILFRWRAARGGRHSGGRSVSAIAWECDERFPEPSDSTQRCVLEALAAEGAAPAGRVFKGTSHLNTVVRVTAIEPPVVVRRKVTSPSRLERSFLSEHAVLAAIERSGVRVRSPKVLALGSNLGDPFAIHSYEGPTDGLRPPNHPVDGLLPAEADDLVDQLCELTRVDPGPLDPTAGQVDFCDWLREELVRLVHQLPGESQKLARELGLPDGHQLRDTLRRFRVSPRTQSLLHGDLNPWNLVRRSGGGLTIIDWEMALIGDPLYDLVRHLHLTPARQEIRSRMFHRWSRLLPEECTRGWEEDRHVYRWIEIIRSAYVDLDRLVTGASLDAPNVRRAVDSYASTLAAATAALGVRAKPTANPYLALALPQGDHVTSSRAASGGPHVRDTGGWGVWRAQVRGVGAPTGASASD
ncbi:aminoglycoside phosphotransferase family protein [Streptomyces sp. E11-3]